MRLPPWLLSSVFPLCATTGSSAVPAPGLIDFQIRTLHHSPLVTARFQASPPGPPADRSALYVSSIYGHNDVRVPLTQIKPVATALQQKVSD